MYRLTPKTVSFQILRTDFILAIRKKHPQFSEHYTALIYDENGIPITKFTGWDYDTVHYAAMKFYYKYVAAVPEPSQHDVPIAI